LFGKIRDYLGPLFHKLAGERGCRILEGHLCRDHVHMCVEIPPKYPVSKIVGYIKGKSAIHISRDFEGRIRNFAGQSFWARGYYVSTVGRDEAKIRAYIRDQEKMDQRMEQMRLG
jgi:putative transposase